MKRKPNWFPIVLVVYCLLTPTPPVLNWWPIDHRLCVSVCEGAEESERERENRNRIRFCGTIVTAWLSPVFFHHVIFLQLLHGRCFLCEERPLCLCTDCGRHFIAHCDCVPVLTAVFDSHCSSHFCFSARLCGQRRESRGEESDGIRGKCSLWDLQIEYAI